MSEDTYKSITTEERYRFLRRELMPLFGTGEATAMARLIFHALKGWDTTGLVVHAADVLSPFILERIEEIVRRLQRGEPLQYILGEGRFYGMTLKVDRSTLIPRPETEELVEAIAERYGSLSDLRVLDVGTGSGAIAIALSRNLRFAEVTALDVSPAALKVAEENARTLHARIRFVEADIFDWIPAAEEYDIIVSNPPYICDKEKKDMERNVLDFEPAGALFVPDDDPLRFYRRIAEIGLRGLCKGGMLYFEINPLYASELKLMLTDMGYESVEVWKDLSGKDRFASACLS
ncbi:MAG: peptide chain release factor N(5)-glutamine methyltransferase [Muribaculaceae bacterium]|nr:peptide chain release factor N(5)-glutamine methyltransferase [Muribaculaceae bacterium]